MPEDSLPAARITELLHAALHEIAGPAGQIHRIAEFIQQSSDSRDGDLQSWLSYLTTASSRLTDSLQALRRYAEALEIPHERSRFTLEQSVNSAKISLASHCNIETSELPVIEADPRRVHLLMSELLKNASKFRTADVCEIRISAANEGANVVVSVADNGIGIEPRQIERIFNPFVRVWGDRFPGSGMGLTIARTLVETWSGRIWVEPGQQGGSVFRFTVPAAVRISEHAT